jgi:hypothetical protein
MSKKKTDSFNAEAPIPLILNDIKVTYSTSDITTNWLLNQILGTKDLQITKIPLELILKFLYILDKSNLEMQDGTNSLLWLKQRISKRYGQSQSQRGQTWEDISRRYQFILEQIDLLLVMKEKSNS